MRILLLNQAFYPDPVATSQQITTLATYLQKRGCEVSVIADSRGYNRRRERYPKEQVYNGVKIHRVFSTGFGKGNLIYRLIDALSFFVGVSFRFLTLQKQDYVIAYTSPPFISVFAMIYCKVMHAKLVLWKFDLHPFTAIAVGYLRANSLAGKLLRWVFKKTLENSDHIIVLDKWMEEKIIESGAVREKIEIIPPWPIQEIEPTKSPLTISNFRKEHGLEKKFVVLYSGNHSVVHPLETILKAATQLREDPHVVFLFIGSGVRVRDVDFYVKKFALTNIIQLPTQPTEKLGEVLESADLHVVVMGEKASGLVHPSKIYGVLATGKPYVFIGPERSLIGELLEACPFGYQVKHGEVSHLISVIRKCQALTIEELSLISKKNKDFLETRFSSSTLIESFMQRVLHYGGGGREAHVEA